MKKKHTWYPAPNQDAYVCDGCKVLVSGLTFVQYTGKKEKRDAILNDIVKHGKKRYVNDAGWTMY